MNPKREYSAGDQRHTHRHTHTIVAKDFTMVAELHAYIRMYMIMMVTDKHAYIHTFLFVGFYFSYYVLVCGCEWLRTSRRTCCDDLVVEVLRCPGLLWHLAAGFVHLAAGLCSVVVAYAKVFFNFKGENQSGLFHHNVCVYT